MNAHQRRKAYRLGSRLLHSKADVKFTLPRACGVEFHGRVVQADWRGRVEVLSSHVAGGSFQIGLHRLSVRAGAIGAYAGI